jgi:GNAT superfamily N-acetyltransferase
MSEIEYSNMADCPGLKGLVARWLWSFWGAPGNFEFYRSMTEHCNKDGIPALFIAFIDDMPVGTVALLRADLFSRQDLYPWMADLYVPPEHRNRGIGSALQDFVLDEAKKQGFDKIYLYTPLTGYYEKNGWEFMCEEMDRDCQIVRIYMKQLF